MVLLIAGELQRPVEDAMAMYANETLATRHVLSAVALAARKRESLLLAYNADNYWISWGKRCQSNYEVCNFIHCKTLLRFRVYVYQ